MAPCPPYVRLWLYERENSSEREREGFVGVIWTQPFRKGAIVSKRLKTAGLNEINIKVSSGVPEKNLRRATSGTRAIGSAPLVYGVCRSTSILVSIFYAILMRSSHPLFPIRSGIETN